MLASAPSKPPLVEPEWNTSGDASPRYNTGNNRRKRAVKRTDDHPACERGESAIVSVRLMTPATQTTLDIHSFANKAREPLQRLDIALHHWLPQTTFSMPLPTEKEGMVQAPRQSDPCETFGKEGQAARVAVQGIAPTSPTGSV